MKRQRIKLTRACRSSTWQAPWMTKSTNPWSCLLHSFSSLFPWIPLTPISQRLHWSPDILSPYCSLCLTTMTKTSDSISRVPSLLKSASDRPDCIIMRFPHQTNDGTNIGCSEMKKKMSIASNYYLMNWDQFCLTFFGKKCHWWQSPWWQYQHPDCQ